MSFQKITWVDRQSEHPTRRRLVTTDTQQEFGTYDVERAEGTVGQTGTPYDAEHMNGLQDNIEAAFVEVDNNIAAAYDATSTYSEGDLVIYQGVLYQSNVDITTAEAWDSTKWDAVKLSEIMGTGSAVIDDSVVSTETAWSSSRIAGFLPTDTASGAIASFPDGANGIPVDDLTATIVPKQSGTGDPSPTNVRPISGWSECNVTRTGVNLWDEEWEVGGINVTTGANANFDDRIRSKNYIPIRPSISIYVKASSTYISVCFYDENKVFISGAQSSSAIRIAPSNAYFIRFSLGSDYGATYGNNVSVNYPSTDTSYHAYTGTTATIPFGQTVYGATLDVTTGVLTIDRAMIKLKDLSYEAVGSGTSTRFQVYNFPQLKPTGSNTQLGKSVCTTYPVKIWNTLNQSDDCYMVVNGSSSYMAIRDTNYSDATDFYNSLTDNDYMCYEMLTPTTIQLTPTEVKTLLGQNNIFADTGSVSVKYRADIGLYIDKKTA